MKQILAVLGFLLLLASPQGAPAQAAHLILHATSALGRTLTLDFPTPDVTRSNKTALLCAHPAAQVVTAKLWMDQHGHGSTPTQLVAAPDGCTTIERINFVMTGTWQVLLTFEDQDTARFTVDVTEPRLE